jgi:hypothetical protein
LHAYRDPDAAWWYEAKICTGNVTRVNIVSRYALPMMKTARFAHYEYMGIVHDISNCGYGIKNPLIILVKSLLGDLRAQIEAGEVPERNVVKFITRSIEGRDNVRAAVSKDFEINSAVCRLATALDGRGPVQLDADDALVVSLKCSLMTLCLLLN